MDLLDYYSEKIKNKKKLCEAGDIGAKRREATSVL